MIADIHQVVTFSTEPFGGNPAFVVSSTHALPDATLTALAGQLNELVLASLRLQDGRPASLSFHTRDGRHGGAGHAMMAAARVALDALGIDETAVALADGSLRTLSREGTRIAIPWPAMPATALDMREALGSALGAVPKETLDAPFGYVAIFDRPASVRDLKPDMEAISHLNRGAVIATAPGDRSDFVIRVFAPKLGLPEDPVCGTAHRILAPYWAAKTGRSKLHSRQLSPRGGDLWCRLDGDRVVISGDTLTFLKGTIELPDP